MKTLRRYKVLVIDQDLETNRILNHLLAERDYEVDTAVSINEGLEMSQWGLYDVVIVNFHMPGMDGLEPLEKIRQISPDTSIVTIDLFGPFETVIKANKYGACSIFKPFKEKDVLRIIDKAATRCKLLL